MTETLDQLIQARFDEVANPSDDADWADVLARARATEPVRRLRRAPVRLAVPAAAAVLAVTVTAVAFGWPGAVVEFFKAPPAPESVKAFFVSHNAAFPSGLNPDTKLGEPREIMTATFDANNLPAENPTLHTLYVAPRDGGGFCFIWTDLGGSCADAENAAQAKTDPAARPVGLDWLENDYAGLVDGWIRSDAQKLEAQFADGTSAAIPVTWVSAPISAGFFAYVVPASHQTRTDALTSIVALDASGNVVSKQPFELTKPLDEDVLQTLPDGTKISLPRRAQATRAQEPFNFRTASGSHAYLWVMPRTGGGTCFFYSTGAGGGLGCASPYWAARLPAVNGSGTDGVYFAQVKPGIATIELRYQNGASERVRPTDGYVLHELEPDARLAEVIGLDQTGRAIFTQHLRAQVRPSGG